MKQIKVGIRELKGHLGEYVQRVKEAATLVITERGKPVGRIVPIAGTVEERLAQLAAANRPARGTPAGVLFLQSIKPRTHI